MPGHESDVHKAQEGQGREVMQRRVRVHEDFGEGDDEEAKHVGTLSAALRLLLADDLSSWLLTASLSDPVECVE